MGDTKIYKHKFVNKMVMVGDQIKMGDILVVVIQIVKVDFDERRMWFQGVDRGFIMG